MLGEVIGIVANCENSDDSAPQMLHIAIASRNEPGPGCVSDGVLGLLRASPEINPNNIPLNFPTEVS